MSFILINILLLLAMALSAFLGLIQAKPSYNSLFLLIQLVIITLYLLVNNYINFTNLSIMILLIIFCLIMLVISLYLEKSIQLPTKKASKKNIFIGGILFSYFSVKIFYFETDILTKAQSTYSIFGKDFAALFFAAFVLFSILISAVLVLNTKNSG